MEAWIGLGSNMGEPEARLREAIRRLGETDGIELKRCSAFYLTTPWGQEGQDEEGPQEGSDRPLHNGPRPRGLAWLRIPGFDLSWLFSHDSSPYFSPLLRPVS